MAAADLLDQPAPTTGAGGRLAHLRCCSQTTAMCGERLAGRSLSPAGRPPPNACAACRVVSEMGVPCSEPGCPNGTARGEAG